MYTYIYTGLLGTFHASKLELNFPGLLRFRVELSMEILEALHASTMDLKSCSISTSGVQVPIDEISTRKHTQRAQYG